MKSLTLVIVLVALIIAGDAFLQNGAAARQGKTIITIKAKYSVEQVKTPSFLGKLFRSDCLCKPSVSCTASSPGEYAKVAGTIISAVHKGFRTAAVTGVKFAAKNASKFFNNMMLVGKIVTSI